MCFYFIIIFFLERKINVWEESLPPLMITLVFGVGLYWKIPICGLQKNEKLLSLTNLWFLCTTLGFARWKSLIHSSVSLPPTPELILTSPTRLLTRLTEHAPPLLVVHTLLYYLLNSKIIKPIVWLDVVKIVQEIDPSHDST